MKIPKVVIISIFLLGAFTTSLVFALSFPEEASTIYRICRGDEIIPRNYEINYTFYRTTTGMLALDSEEHITWARVDGESMLPFLENNQTILITRDFDANRLRIGNVISYNHSDANISIFHLIEDIKVIDGRKCFIAKGTNNFNSDTLSKEEFCIYKKDINGVLVGVL